MHYATINGIGSRIFCLVAKAMLVAADNRLFVEAVLFRYRAGVPWRDLPERFGGWKVVYQRFNR